MAPSEPAQSCKLKAMALQSQLKAESSKLDAERSKKIGCMAMILCAN